MCSIFNLQYSDVPYCPQAQNVEVEEPESLLDMQAGALGFDWPPYLKLLLALLHELQQTTDPELLLPLLRALNLLVLHGDALRQAALKWPAHVDHFLRKYIVPRYVLLNILV